MDSIQVVESFLPEREKKYEKEERLCVRFFRKKYKCVILWALASIIFMQAVILIIDKVDIGQLITLLMDKTKQETQSQSNNTILMNILEQNKTSQKSNT